jgi:hypothetical protein
MINRRNFLKTANAGAIGGTFLSGLSSCSPLQHTTTSYEEFDEILKRAVLKRELFSDPVIIDSIELLRYNKSFLYRVRSTL